MPFTSEPIIRCDCPCGQTIPINGVPYLIVGGYEVREADTPIACPDNLVFVGIDDGGNHSPAAAFGHLAAYLAVLEQQAAPAAAVATEPDPYLVAHFAVQSMDAEQLRKELRATGKQQNVRRLVAREEVYRRARDGRARDVDGIEQVGLEPGMHTADNLPKVRR